VTKPEDKVHEDAGRQAFLKLAGPDQQVDAFKLLEILNGLFKKGSIHDCFCSLKEYYISYLVYIFEQHVGSLRNELYIYIYIYIYSTNVIYKWQTDEMDVKSI